METINTKIRVIDLSQGDAKYNITHIIGGLFIVALILLIVQIYHINTEFYKRSYTHPRLKNKSEFDKSKFDKFKFDKSVIIETEKGVIYADNKNIIRELQEIMLQLQTVNNIRFDDDKINRELNKSIKNLKQFVSASMTPENSISGYAGDNTGKVNLSEALCTVDLQNNIIDQAMIDSVNPNEFSYSKSYNTVLEDENENDMGGTVINENVILSLIRHLDITIRFLRNDVCKGGKLDISQLYKILYELNKKLIEKGKNHASEFNASPWDLNSLITNESESGVYDNGTRGSGIRSGQYTPAKIAGESRSNVPLFLRETSNIEPFRGGMGGMSMRDGETRNMRSMRDGEIIYDYEMMSSDNSEKETQIRGMPDKNNIIQNRDDKYGEFSSFNINIRNKFGSLANSLIENCGPCGGPCKCPIGCRCGGCRKCGAAFASFINSYEKRITPDYTALNNSMLRKNKNAYTDNLGKITYFKNPIVGMPFIGDNTVEGIAERDIMQHKTPGNILSTIRDNSHYYTVRSGSCGGTTPSDADFFKECTTKDLIAEDALNGSPDKMLSCVGECDREPNYMNYYSQIANASAGVDTYGVDFEIPKIKPNKKNYNI